MKILLIVALLFSVSAMGQKRTDTVAYPNEKLIIETDSITTVKPAGGYMFNGIWDNWFVAAGIGGQVFFGNQNDIKPIGKRITPTYEGSAGKWIHPYYGFRAKMGGGEIRSYTTGDLPIQGRKSLVVGGPDENGIYTMKWHHLYGEGDFMVNLSNMIGGYKPARFYSAIPYLGFGLDFVQEQPKHDADRSATGVFGVINQFRITRDFDANLELRGALVKQTFDRQVTGVDFEALATLSVGVVYHIGASGKRPFRKASNISTVVERRLVGEISLHKDAGKVNVDSIVQVVRDSIAGTRHILAAPVAVFFDKDKATITPTSKVNLAFIAGIIKESGGARFMLTASADSYTATSDHNLQLSVRRSKAVRDYFVQVLMVDPAQLVLDPVGGIDRYKPAYINRVVIIRQEEKQP
jgi:outer membrane protein OmpA-like peptidoglycan-associated protein